MSSLLNNILSSIDPTAVPKPAAPGARQSQAAGVPKPIPRPSGGGSGATGSQAQKRKAEGPSDGVQAKIQRKDGPTQPPHLNGNAAARPTPISDATKPKTPTGVSPLPYRGTAGMGSSSATGKPSNIGKKPAAVASANYRPATSMPKGPGTAPPSGAAPATGKKSSYAAMLQAAKEKQQAKPTPPPVKHEPTKIMTKKERLALRAEMKGKKPGLVRPTAQGGQIKAGDVKADTRTEPKEKRKAPDLGYQGTARPAKKPMEVGYKGTAKSSAGNSGPAGKPSGPPAVKSKPKPPAGRYDGYANWSDLSDAEEEEDFDSEGSSDMEGGVWDVEEEEQLAAKIARKEDAEALAEENELKRQKEERKRRLLAMNKAAAAKRKY